MRSDTFPSCVVRFALAERKNELQIERVSTLLSQAELHVNR